MSITKKEIVDYYDNCETDYRLLWSLDKSFAMHAGYWDQTTRTLHEALLRENQVLAGIVGITAEDHVLDAGCGVGGSAIYLAKNYGCKVTGITLSEKQVLRARSYASQFEFKNPPEFFAMDFTRTDFPDESFDVVWAIESICHADDKSLFLKEAYRLLKKEGRLIIADAFLEPGGAESEDMRKWLNGWGVNSLDTEDAFRSHLQVCGFKKISFLDITQNVLPSSKRLYYYSFPAYAISKVGELIGARSKKQTDNIASAYYQYTTLAKGLWRYGIFCGLKE